MWGRPFENSSLLFLAGLASVFGSCILSVELEVKMLSLFGE